MLRLALMPTYQVNLTRNPAQSGKSGHQRAARLAIPSR